LADSVAPHLVSGVELLSLDAGNTVIFLDHERLARSSRRAVFAPSASDIDRGEREQKKRAETGALVDVEWKFVGEKGAPQWGRTVATILSAAGLSNEHLAETLNSLWVEHVERNFWCNVPVNLADALGEVRAHGVRVAIVSNSEGRLDGLFRSIGLRDLFDDLQDSGVIGIEKPDARIFERAMNACGASPASTLHLGDMFATDILGARNAKIRAALIDPLGHYEGMHPDVDRVPGVVAVAKALVAAKK